MNLNYPTLNFDNDLRVSWGTRAAAMKYFEARKSNFLTLVWCLRALSQSFTTLRLCNIYLNSQRAHDA